MKSSVMEMGSTPAVWAASTKKRSRWRRQISPTCRMGITVPHTLLAWVRITARVFGRISPSIASIHSEPSARQGMRENSTPWAVICTSGRITALCSMAETST